MAVYSKKATRKQRRWLKEYEDATTFEPIHQEDLDSGAMVFREVAKANVEWFETWFVEALHAIPDIPEG